ncbi:hypothetical protein [Embleya sp. NBC_00896]|uniref:hypothetical protein n=1 Tax=Embleya sp. NBC_00896 TaxID=2975961 RepID=UPI003865F4ED|nr:hypothetical protein OG928_31590 [Embleya sp. NBC_00896]
MTVRNEIEAAIRAWHHLEIERGGAPIIDFDFFPEAEPVPAASDRLAVYARLSELAATPAVADAPRLATRLTADLAYLGAQLGERPALDEYIRATQGCAAVGWSVDYVTERAALACELLEAMGIGWHDATDRELRIAEEPLDAELVAPEIRVAAAEFEPAVRKVTESEASYELTIECVDVDAYWAYWLDGAGRHVRLRLNPRNARFTRVGARQFALHEVLGHGLQAASFAHRCTREEVPWVRVLSVHGPTQVVLEGLAQALPLFVAPDDTVLIARVRLDHYLQLVRSELHLAINRGVSVAACAAHARARVPFWTDEQIADLIGDRGANPLLRSYLWAYPAGFDWFVRLAEGGGAVAADVLRAAYRTPLAPEDLHCLWAQGPQVGGSGSPLPPRALAHR